MDYQEFKRDLMEVLSEKMEREVKLSFRQIPKNNGIMWEAIVIEKKRGKYFSYYLYTGVF